ncbi:DUF4304 domain-containing protein [Micromonospora sp. NPDC050200]|uniref:DUF4304 domain-containing protein n=1 Tax=Micromonospora sp. NPDC050200 TaxID=3155664 RepID=UPI0033F6BB9A
MTPRDAMNQALKGAVREHLRPRGFTGAMPHFRRRSSQQTCLLSIQFYSSGGSFVAEVAECGPDGYETSWGERKTPQKVTAQDIPDPRLRLGSPNFPDGDHWFIFGPRNYEPGAAVVHPRERYDAIATHLIQLIDEQAEPFWREQLDARTSA